MCRFYNAKKLYRRFTHDINYRDGYYRKVLITLFILIIIDLMLLYLVW